MVMYACTLASVHSPTILYTAAKAQEVGVLVEGKFYINDCSVEKLSYGFQNRQKLLWS